MVWGDYLLLENPVVLAIAAGVFLFVVIFTVLQKFSHMERGIVVLVGLIAGAIGAWRLYAQRFYGWEATLVIAIYVLFGAVMLKIFWGFARGSKKNFG